MEKVELFSVCLKCLSSLEKNGVMHNWHCPTCGSEVNQVFALCFTVREIKNIVFAECDSCKSRYRCFTERAEMDDCEWQGCKQVILANGMDSDEVWCNLQDRPCMESPNICPHRIDSAHIKNYNEDDWRKER